MARKFIDCRQHPDPSSKCTVAISADSEAELLEAAVQHGVSVHGMQDSPELRNELKTLFKEGAPAS
jgi:predicted small metal-binding protein